MYEREFTAEEINSAQVCVLIRNDRVHKVFASRKLAEEYVRADKGWNLWKYVETELING